MQKKQKATDVALEVPQTGIEPVPPLRATGF